MLTKFFYKDLNRIEIESLQMNSSKTDRYFFVSKYDVFWKFFKRLFLAMLRCQNLRLSGKCFSVYFAIDIEEAQISHVNKQLFFHSNIEVIIFTHSLLCMDYVRHGKIQGREL